MGASAPASNAVTVSALTAGGGAVAELIRTKSDWHRSKLGHPSTWPQSLRTALGIVLSSRFPGILFWGESLCVLYNDAYAPLFGAKHPEVLGKTGFEAWGEVWDVMYPMFQRVRRGEATLSEDEFLALHRRGFTEETYVTWSYNPILDETGHVGGVFAAVRETTNRVLAARRLGTLRALGEQVAKAKSIRAACAASIETLAKNRHDVPFAALYLVEGDRALRFGDTIGLDDHQAPPALSLTDGVWSIGEVARSGLPVRASRGDVPLPGGPWPEPGQDAFVLPLAKPGHGSPYGVLVGGISPRLGFDEDYASFYRLVSQHVASSIANAGAERERAAQWALIESSLRESEQRYAALFEESPFPLALTVLPRNTLVAVNRAFEELFELSRDDALGKTSVELGISDRETRDRAASLLATQGYVRNLESMRRTKTGRKLVISMNLTRVLLRGQDHVLTTVDDVSIRREQRDSLDLLVETSGVLASAPADDETLARVAKLAIPRFADSASVHLRRDDGTVEQVVAAGTSADLLRAIHRTGAVDADGQYAPWKIIRTGETDFIEDATPAQIVASLEIDEAQRGLFARAPITSYIGVPLKARGQTVGAIVFARTGTDRPYSRKDLSLAEELGKRASFALENARLYESLKTAADNESRARAKAEEATRLKDEFLATLSHELRTPLNAILGWGRMLQSGGVSTEKQSRALDAIVRNAVAQNQLIDDLLDLSRIVSGKLRLNVDMVDAASVVEGSIDVVQLAADAKGVRIQRLIDTDAGSVPGDASRLQQVVWNLLSNAVKFTPRDGRVHVTLRRGHVHVELIVADTGAGIAPAFLPYVFDRFRQQDGAVNRKTGGLGLGLAIAKSIVELHGGTVEAHSDGEGRGSTFIVRLPLAPARSTLASLPGRRRTLSPAPHGGLHIRRPSEIAGLEILVVDDEEDARDLVRAVLEHCEARVTTVASAAEALENIDASRPDVVVSDIGMPDEDGYVFIRKLRARPRDAGGRIPAVALTAYARAEDRRRALLEGFQSHAAKPIDPQELVIVIANLVGRYS
ncbi:MAG: ATP-binding protein [Polyangiaceae bacterium]